VDSGSTDGSPELALEHGFRVVEHRQKGAFSFTLQRNWALSESGLNSDWVLFLDQDEAIGAACRAAIQRAIAEAAAAEHQGLPAPLGFELTPRFLFLGRWLRRTQGYPNWHPRLVRRGRLQFEGELWESFQVGRPVGRIVEPYEHYAYSQGIDDWLRRHQRYAGYEADRIVAFLAGAGAGALGTRRHLGLRRLAAHLWPLRPLLRFIQKYLLQGGWLEGWQGLLFSLLMAFYDLITVLKVIERRRIDRGLPL
jgi:glycosyltransferase involved in cell wall biosynthesis